MSGTPRRATGKALVAAVEDGEHRAILEAMRMELARAMGSAPPTVIAQVAARLQAVEREIESLPKPKEASVADDLAARRAARRSTSDVRAPAVGDSH